MRRILIPLTLPVLALSLAACGSGRHNENYSEKASVIGASFKADGLGVYDAFFADPAARGGDAVLYFSTYADDDQAATSLRTISATSLSESPATLAEVSDGAAQPTEVIQVPHQTSTGSRLTQATFSDLDAPVISGGYYKVTFAFGNGLTQTLDVPVAQNGAVSPVSGLPPTSFPEQPFVPDTAPPNTNAPIPG